MSHAGFDIPVDHRQRGHVERGVRNHWQEDASGDGEDRTESEPSNHCLFDTGEPLHSVMLGGEPCGRDQHDESEPDWRCLCRNTRTEEFSEALEHPAAENGFFSKTRAKNYSV